jgi:GT2 family glycosyltransferase
VKLFYLPAAQVKHKVSSLTGGKSAFTVRYHTRNHVYYVLKSCSRWQSFLYCFTYYFYIAAKYSFLLHSTKLFWVAHSAFWEGIALFTSQMQPASKKEELNGAQ